MLNINLDTHDIFNALIARAQAGGPYGSKGSKLSAEALAVPGLTSEPIRHFLNLLCEGANYLEVGSLMGASAVAASFENGGKYWAVDNHSEWGSVTGLVATGGLLEGDLDEYLPLTLREGMELTQRKYPSFQFIPGDFRDHDPQLILDNLAQHPLPAA